MNPPNDQSVNPLSVFDTWGQITSDPEWSKIPTNTQSELRHFYWEKQVVPKIKPALQADPETGAQLFKAFFGGEQAELDQRVAAANQAWYNQPFSKTILGLDAEHVGEGPGVKRGVAKFAEGMTSPLQLGLLAGTAGLGGILEGAGAAVNTSRAIQGMVGAGFSAQMVKGLYDSAPEFKAALDKAHQYEAAGDAKSADYYSGVARQIGTEMVLSGGTAYLAGKSGVRDIISGVKNQPLPAEVTGLRRLGYTSAEISKMDLATARHTIDNAIQAQGTPQPTSMAPTPAKPKTPSRKLRVDFDPKLEADLKPHYGTAVSHEGEDGIIVGSGYSRGKTPEVYLKFRSETGEERWVKPTDLQEPTATQQAKVLQNVPQAQPAQAAQPAPAAPPASAQAPESPQAPKPAAPPVKPVERTEGTAVEAAKPEPPTPTPVPQSKEVKETPKQTTPAGKPVEAPKSEAEIAAKAPGFFMSEEEQAKASTPAQGHGPAILEATRTEKPAPKLEGETNKERQARQAAESPKPQAQTDEAISAIDRRMGLKPNSGSAKVGDIIPATAREVPKPQPPKSPIPQPKTPAPVQAPPASPPSGPMQMVQQVIADSYSRLSKGGTIDQATRRDLESILSNMANRKVELSGSLADQMNTLKAFLPQVTKAKKPKVTPAPTGSTSVEADKAAFLDQAKKEVPKEAAPKGVPQAGFEAINDAIAGTGLPMGLRMQLRERALKHYMAGIKAGDPLALRKTIDIVTGKGPEEKGGGPDTSGPQAYPDEFGDAERNYMSHLKMAKKVEQMLSERAQKSVAMLSGELGLEWRGSEMGLAWFHDPKTGSTLAMDLGRAQHIENIRAHVAESRAKFAKGNPIGFAQASLPYSIRKIISKLPQPIQNALAMSPDRAIKIVSTHTDPALRNTLAQFGGEVRAITHGDMTSTFGNYRGFYDPKANRITVQAVGSLERFYNSRYGRATLNEVTAHEVGHAIHKQLGFGDRDAIAAARAYPIAFSRIRGVYERAGTKGNPKLEAFAEAFSDWYMGREGNAEAFEKVLRKNPEVWDAVRDLKGKGQFFNPGTPQPRAFDIAYAQAVGEPNQGYPMTSPVQALGTLWNGDATANKMKGLMQERLGEYYRSKSQLFDHLKALSSRYRDFTPQDLADWSRKMEVGDFASMSPEDAQVARQIRQLLDERRDAIHQIDPSKFEHFIENYFPHIWADPKAGKAFISRVLGSKRPLSGPQTFLKPRQIDFLADGIAAGLDPITNNPVEMAMVRIGEMDRYLFAHKVLADMKSEGMAQFFKFAKRSSIPDGWIPLEDRIFQPKFRTAQGFTQTGQYYAPAQAARILNNYLSPGLRGNMLYDHIRGYGNFLNQLQLGFSAFHLGFEVVEASVSDMAAGLERLINLKDIPGAAKQMGRAIVPGWSAMHAYRIGSLIKSEYMTPGSQPALTRITDAFTRADQRFELDPFYKNSAIEKFWKSWGDRYTGKGALALPFHAAQALAEKLAAPVMEHVVPRVKAGVFAEMAKIKLEQLDAAGVTDRHVINAELDKIAASVDNRLGQMVYDNLFWNRTAKDLGMLSVRSLGWNLGTAREIGGGLKDFATASYKRAKGQDLEFTHRMAYVMALPLVTGFLGATYGYLFGNPPQQPVDYFYPQTGKIDTGGKPERVSLPSYMKDVWAFYHAPGQTVVHKLHPMFEQVAEMYQNQDYYGTEIYHPGDPKWKQAYQLGQFMLKGPTPLSIQNVMERRRQGAGWFESGESFVGITPAPKYIGQTRAEQLAYDFARKHMETGPRTSADFKHSQQVASIRSQFDAGRISSDQLTEAVRKGLISPTELDTIVDEMNMSPLQRHFKRLNPQEALEVWDSAEPNERTLLRPMLADKMDTIPNHAAPEVQDEMLKKFEEALQK